MKLQVVFTYDADYQGYVVDVPQLPGCMSQGKTIEDATANVKDAISGYLAVLDKHRSP
jgi:predicted RNase H-like HicB family nuclease